MLIALLAAEVVRKLSVHYRKKMGRNIPFCTAPSIAHNCDGSLQTNSKGKTYVYFQVEVSNF